MAVVDEGAATFPRRAGEDADHVGPARCRLDLLDPAARLLVQARHELVGGRFAADELVVVRAGVVWVDARRPDQLGDGTQQLLAGCVYRAADGLLGHSYRGLGCTAIPNHDLIHLRTRRAGSRALPPRWPVAARVAATPLPPVEA